MRGNHGQIKKNGETLVKKHMDIKKQDIVEGSMFDIWVMVMNT